MIRLLIHFQGVFADAQTWASSSFAILIAAVAVLPLLRRVRNRYLRRVLSLLLFAAPVCLMAWKVIHVMPSPQTNDLTFATEGNCSATPEDGNEKIVSVGGGCIVRQVNRQLNTYAESNAYSINYTVRKFLSTPGTGFEVVGEDGEAHQLLVRQRGFNVGLNWCNEVSEWHKSPKTGQAEVLRLNDETCVALVHRPDHVLLRLEYDGAKLEIETKFISDLPQKSAFVASPQIVTISYSIIRPQEILALITNEHQKSDDQKGFIAAIPSFGWQKHNEKK